MSGSKDRKGMTFSQTLGIALVTSGLGAAVSGGVSFWKTNAVETRLTRELSTENVHTAVKFFQEEYKVENKANAAFYAVILAVGEVIDHKIACSLSAYAVYSEIGNPKTSAEHYLLADKVRKSLKHQDLIDHYSEEPCNLADLKGPETNTNNPLQVSEPKVEKPICPTGRLFPHYGALEQRPWMEKLSTIDNKSDFIVTASQLIDGYDNAANIPVVRYFFEENNKAAKEWANYLSSATGEKITNEYAKGFENAFSDANKLTFELWWPLSKPVPDDELSADCVPAS